MKTQDPAPVKLICGIIATDEGVLSDVRAQLEGSYGSIDLATDVFPFDFTEYYTQEMGSGLLRQLVSFSALISAARLADLKLETNAVEREHLRPGPPPGRRRVNLDPGYLAPANLVLATTKNFAHRVYLRDGIFAEVTLRFDKRKGIRYSDWTYPDFRRPRYVEFLHAAREKLLADQRPSR